MVMDKDLWKTRSWDLTIVELRRKQQKNRTMMWFTFMIWALFFTAGCLFNMIGFYCTGASMVSISIMLLIVTMVWKYFEMNIDTIIEIRRLKDE